VVLHNLISQLTPILQEHDPDIQNIPLFATAPAFLETMKSSYYGGFEFVWDAVAEVAVRIQKYTYYPVMALARFNLYILSWGFLLSPRAVTKGKMWWTRPTEVLGISTYFFLYFYVLLWCNVPTWTSRAIFILTSHLITMPLHVQITLSHWGTSTADLGPGESFAQRQLRTTMDVACPQWLDFIHGGLQFQAVHHLFPRVPRHNLRRLQALVKDFCKETEIEYMIHGFAAGNGVVLGRLQEVAEQAKMMAACQKHMAETGESGLH
jgi:delta8-fatty-acid desaturase